MDRNIFIILHNRFPGEKAASLFAALEARAFADLKIPTTLLVPRRFGRLKKDPYEYYGVPKNFKVIYLPTLDLIWLPFLKTFWFGLSTLVFGKMALVYLFFRAKKGDVMYSNEAIPLFLISLFFRNTLYALHDFPKSFLWFYRMFFKRVRWILATNNWKRETLIKYFGVKREKVLMELNGVDVEAFSLSIDQEEARRKLTLPLDKKIVLYTGHLYEWKGIFTLADSSKYLGSNIFLVFVGGTSSDVDSFKKRFGNEEGIKIVGFRPHSEIPLWQRAADVLVLPNSGKEEISRHWTSPMKLFEYMASGKPIVASDLSSIREVVDGKSVYFTAPDDPKALAEGIRKVLGDQELAGSLAKKAHEEVQNHSFKKRAERILSFIGMRK